MLKIQWLWTTCLLGAGLLWLGAPASAVPGAFSIVPEVGYEAADLGQKNSGGGLTVGAFGDYGFTRLAGGPTLLGGLGLKYDKLSFSTDGNSADVTLVTLGAEVGVGFALAQKLELEMLLGYDFLVSGSYSGNGTGSKTISNFSRINHEYRALFSVFPTTNIGFGIGWFAGSFDVSDVASDLLYQGYEIKFLIAHHF